MPGLAQGLGQHLGLGAGPAVDDAGLALARGGKAQNLVARGGLDGERKVDVRPVKAAQERGRGLPVEQAGDDLAPGFLVRGGGEGGKRHAQGPAQIADPQIVGAEVVAPLADAMRLVDRDQAAVRPPQQAQRRARGQAFRRHVQQL